MRKKHAETLRGFIESKRRNAWLSSGSLRVFVRNSKRLFDAEMRSCLDIATVEVAENKRGTGVFREFLAAAETVATEKGLELFVENVMEERFRSLFERMGWDKLNEDSTGTASFRRIACSVSILNLPASSGSRKEIQRIARKP